MINQQAIHYPAVRGHLAVNGTRHKNRVGDICPNYSPDQIQRGIVRGTLRITTELEKRCSNCNEYHPADSHHWQTCLSRNTKIIYILHAWCRPCFRERTRTTPSKINEETAMQLHVYNKADQAWSRVLTFQPEHDAIIRHHAAHLGRIGSPEIAGLRIMDNQRIIAHWNVMQGWVEHGATQPAPGLTPQKSQDKRPLKHPEYVKPENQSRKKERRCLGCKKLFPSSGPGNRLCETCRSRGDDDPMAVYHAHIPERA